MPLPLFTPAGSRRAFIGLVGRSAAALAVGGVLGALLYERHNAQAAPAAPGAAGSNEPTVWQIDPAKCIQCGRCATECVLTPSAVKCYHAHALCGYCDLCTGYFEAQAPALNTAAENQQCPTAAIQRRFVEDPYYEYVIDRDLCIGCAKCVKGCNAYGNGSLYLQIDQKHCVGCNQCGIARHCPSGAIARVPVAQPYKTTRVRGT
jgi:electron transport complex protein RnfB